MMFLKINNKKSLFQNIKKIYFILIIIVIFTIDRFSKLEIINNFYQDVFYLNDFINFDLIWNTGIGFGLLSSDSNLIYNSVTILVGLVILILFYISITSQNLDKLIYSVIIGGALGNFYDRMIYSAVPDFIDLHYNDFHWFTFNGADIFITLGIIAFLIKSFLVKN